MTGYGIGAPVADGEMIEGLIAVAIAALSAVVVIRDAGTAEAPVPRRGSDTRPPSPRTRRRAEKPPRPPRPPKARPERPSPPKAPRERRLRWPGRLRPRPRSRPPVAGSPAVVEALAVPIGIEAAVAPAPAAPMETVRVPAAVTPAPAAPAAAATTDILPDWPGLSPDPDRLIQTEVTPSEGFGRRLLAFARLVIWVALSGVALGLVIIGGFRGLVLLFERL